MGLQNTKDREVTVIGKPSKTGKCRCTQEVVIGRSARSRPLGRQRQPLGRESPLYRRPSGEAPGVRGPMRKITRHIKAEDGTTSPCPVDQQIRIGDAVALADRPWPFAYFRVDRLPELAAGLFGGGGGCEQKRREWSTRAS